ncbi:MAG: glycosyltransferase [Elusimicrobia bacterium]|nr:glycosyltransferase [Elusimicrobiota bacterium]
MRRPLRIAVFLPNLGGGGAEKIAVHLANALAGLGYEVDLVLALAEGPYLADVSPGVSVVDLGARRLLTAILPLVRYLRKRRPVVLFSHLEYANIGAVLARALSWAPTRLVLVEHATLSAAFRQNPTRKKSFLLFAAMRLYPRADRVIAVSRGSAEDLIRFIGVPERLVRVIFNPVVVPQIKELSTRPAGHRWLEPGGPPVVLGIGRLTPQKDFQTLIAAFALLRKDRDCRLLILGEGEQRAELERLIASRGLAQAAELPGFVKNPYSFLARCSVFALSSVWEALPTVLIEALSLGARVVSTDCPAGPREILQDGKFGRLVPPGDARALARALSEAMSEAPAAIPESALRPFTLPVAAGAYAGLIEELAGGRRAMKILLVTENLDLGGAETLVVGLAGALAGEQGFEAALTATDGPLRERLDSAVRFFPLTRYSPLKTPVCVADLRSILRELRPDIVHAHGFTVGALAALAAKTCGLRPKMVLTHHSRETTRLPSALGAKLMNLCFDRLVAISKAKYDGLLADGIPAERICRIPNFIDCDAVARRLAAVDLGSVRRELSLAPAQRVILTAGRLIPEKRMDRFIEIAARYGRSARERPVAVILGDGPERGRLDALARKHAGEVRVELLGYQTDVYKYLAVAGAFLFPSEHAEVLPMVLIEAQASGVPAVCSDIAGNDEIVVDGVTGYLVRGGDEQYCARLASVMDDEGRGREFSRRSVETARARFDKKAVVRLHAQLYESL